MEVAFGLISTDQKTQPHNYKLNGLQRISQAPVETSAGRILKNI